jgi:hypothetical protein
MNRAVIGFGGLLLLSLGASWSRYTSDKTVAKDGVLLAEGKKAELERIVYDAPELDVTFEQRKDDFGSYGWVVVEEQKAARPGSDEKPEKRQSRFKVSADKDKMDKLMESFAPLMALRELKDVSPAQRAQFGLEAPTTRLTLRVGGRETVLAVGGETYGSKDVYVQDTASQRIFVLDDEVLKPLKFAGTRLPERSLVAAKVEAVSGVTLSSDSSQVEWTQQNRDDRAAAFWKRGASEGKDETFGNWFDKLLKVKSVNYVQEGEAPAELVNAFAVTVRAEGFPAETVQLLRSGDDWYARSESTRGLVKLPRGSAKDVADDVRDVVEGKAPPPDAPPAPPTSDAGKSSSGAEAPSGAAMTPAAAPEPPATEPGKGAAPSRPKDKRDKP